MASSARLTTKPGAGKHRIGARGRVGVIETGQGVAFGLHPECGVCVKGAPGSSHRLDTTRFASPTLVQSRAGAHLRFLLTSRIADLFPASCSFARAPRRRPTGARTFLSARRMCEPSRRTGMSALRFEVPMMLDAFIVGQPMNHGRTTAISGERCRLVTPQSRRQAAAAPVPGGNSRQICWQVFPAHERSILPLLGGFAGLLHESELRARRVESPSTARRPHPACGWIHCWDG